MIPDPLASLRQRKDLRHVLDTAFLAGPALREKLEHRPFVQGQGRVLAPRPAHLFRIKKGIHDTLADAADDEEGVIHDE